MKNPQKNACIDDYIRLLEESYPSTISRLSKHTRHVFANIWMEATRNSQDLSDKSFYRASRYFEKLETHPERDFILNGALQVCNRHWTLVNAFLVAAVALPHEQDFIRQWIRLADGLSLLDTVTDRSLS